MKAAPSEVTDSGAPATKEEAIAFLMRAHYGHFLRDPRFWYEPELRDADALVCLAASELRAELRRAAAKMGDFQAAR